jgi:hypothetical protein
MLMTDSTDLLQQVLDAFPALSLLVEDDVSVVAFNSAASRALSLDERSLRQLTGNVLFCVNAFEGGCGHTHKCKNCDVRLSISAAYSGEVVERRRTKMRLRVDGQERDFYLLVSTAPFEYGGALRVLLVIENITELVVLRDLLPECPRCRRRRDELDYWQRVDDYMTEHDEELAGQQVCERCTAELSHGGASSSASSG